MARSHRLTAIAAVTLFAAPAVAQQWWSNYNVGDQVRFTISGQDADVQTCTVAEIDPSVGLRVQCPQFKHWSAGRYIAYSKDNIRDGGGQAQAPAAPAAPGPAGRTPVGGDKWWSGYAVGDRVMFTISGARADLQSCTVAEADPENGLRVQCGPFKHWSAGSYIVYSPDNLGGGAGAAPAQGAPAQQAAPPPAPTPPRGVGAAGQLKPGEYACVGAGGRHIPGLGFKLAAGGQYTSLDGTSTGRVTTSASGVRFTGGQLDGQVGRWIDANSFALGQVQCAPWQ